MSGAHDMTGASLAEAAAWRVHLAEAGVDSSAEFEAWLAEPGKEKAWTQISGPWEYFGEHASAPELVAARQAALAHAGRASTQRKPPRDWRRMATAMAAVCVLGLIGLGVVVFLERPAEYATALGERRVLTLEDGSRVSLDSDSDVTIRYTKTARELHLLHGQARFDVAHDVERPFSVVAGDQKVIATGTAFNIDMAGSKVVVTLIQGHVVVLSEDAPARALAVPEAPSPRHRAVELTAGEQLAAIPDRAPIVASVNLQRVTAWMNGQLMFDNEPLVAVVARINRYTATPIVIDDPKVAALRISGVFNTGDVAGFVDIVTHYLPVTATTSDNGQIDLRARN